MGRDDLVRLVLFAMTLGGVMVAAAAGGDLQHWRSLCYAGVATAIACGLALLRVELERWRRPVPESPQVVEVVDISSAPSAVAQNTENLALLTSRVDCHAIHLRAMYRVMMDAADKDGLPESASALRVVPPASREGSAGLCPAGARVGLIAGRP